MRIATCNVQNNPDLPRKKVRRVAEIAGEHATIIGFQEIREKEDFTDILRGLNRPEDGFLEEFDIPMNHLDTSSPVAFSTYYWTLIDAGFDTLHGPIKGVTPKRFASWCVLEKNTGKKKIAVVNTHFINKAWNDKETNARVLSTRRDCWTQGWTVTHMLVRQLRILGFPVFVLGDFNRLYVETFHKKMDWLDDEGIDKIGFIPRKGVKFDLRETYVVNTPSDHHLNVVGGKLLVP